MRLILSCTWFDGQPIVSMSKPQVLKILTSRWKLRTLDGFFQGKRKGKWKGLQLPSPGHLACAASTLPLSYDTRQPPTFTILYMYCTDSTECLSRTPGSHVSIYSFKYWTVSLMCMNDPYIDDLPCSVLLRRAASTWRGNVCTERAADMIMWGQRRVETKRRRKSKTTDSKTITQIYFLTASRST